MLEVIRDQPPLPAMRHPDHETAAMSKIGTGAVSDARMRAGQRWRS